jgi:RNA polymerase sigma-70 factor (sigma-E family)
LVFARGGTVNGSDEADFESFVRLAAPSLIGLAYTLCSDRGRAQDASQIAFERVYQRWGRLDDPWAYARRVTVNATRDGWRRFGRRVQVGLPEQSDAGHEPYPAADGRDEMVRALRTLPRGQRAVLHLRFWQDLTEAQTAAALGISIGTVKSQTSRALKRLRLDLAIEGDVYNPGATR